jgi:hypothetical protein
MWRNCPHKEDKQVWTNFQQNLKLFREQKEATRQDRFDSYRRPATTLANWQRSGFPNKQIHDQIIAIADTDTNKQTRLTLLASLKDSLTTTNVNEDATDYSDRYEHKKVKWTKNIGKSFLLYMTPQTPTMPRAFISAPPWKDTGSK